MENTRKKLLLSKATLLLTAIIWGGGFIFSQIALDAGLGPAAVLLGKFGIAAVLFAAIYGRRVLRKITRRDIARGIPVGLLLAGGFFAQTYGLKYSSPSNNALITAAYVVITPFLWRVVNRKKPRAVIYAASVLCLIGVAVLSVNFAGGIHLALGDMLTLLCAFLFAGQIVATETAVSHMDTTVLLFIQFITAAVCALIAFLITERDFTPFLNPRGLGALLFLGVLSTGLCYFMQTAAQRYVPSSSAAMLLSTESLFGAAFSVAFGYDAMSLRLIVGAVLVLTSVALPDMLRDRSKMTRE
ncbi:MAG: DMT family transporter [Oscillospiraceae bacterium]|nr:DMT family transporter [Oscillospiraceae bacterium]